MMMCVQKILLLLLLDRALDDVQPLADAFPGDERRVPVPSSANSSLENDFSDDDFIYYSPFFCVSSMY